MVALAIRWGVPERTKWNPVLSGMPGTACGLARGDVTHPLYESRMHWIPDPTPSPPRRTGQELSVKNSDSLAPIPSDSVRSRDIPVTVRKTIPKAL